MLVCYLDDSGEEKEPVITLAGLISPANNWLDFEHDARVLFDASGISYLHTVDLHHRRNEFEGWDSGKTLEFAEALFKLVGHHVGFGVEFSVLKSGFSAAKRAHGRTRETSAMSMCFRGVLDRILKDPGFQDAERNGADLSFVVECGHKNNGDIRARFNAIKRKAPARLGSLIFEDKKKYIALQTADFIAFYSRRVRNATPQNPRTRDQIVIDRTIGTIKHVPFLATSFGPER